MLTQLAYIVSGKPISATIPQNLAPGNYLIRHEIIALHLATSVGGAEFYPSCAQVKVGGSGSGSPKAADLVAFPGGYSDNDPGIFDPSVSILYPLSINVTSYTWA